MSASVATTDRLPYASAFSSHDRCLFQIYGVLLGQVGYTGFTRGLCGPMHGYESLRVNTQVLPTLGFKRGEGNPQVVTQSHEPVNRHEDISKVSDSPFVLHSGHTNLNPFVIPA